MKQLITLIAILLSGIGFSQTNALKFDGSTITSSSDRVATSFIGLADSSARTVEMWIKRGTTSTAQGIMSEWGGGTTTNLGPRFTVKVQNNHLRYESGGSASQYSLEGTTYIGSSQWYHVAFVIDPMLTTDRLKIYLNGNLEASGYVYLNTNATSEAPLTIGTRFNGVGGFNGAIDEYRVWNVARTQAEIQANMNSEICTLPSELIHYFKFNEGIAGGNNTAISTVVDEVNPLATNTLTNMTLTGTFSNFVTGTVNSSTNLVVTTASSCTNYTWAENGQTYNSSGLYDVVYTNVEGCDSTVRLDLTINSIDNTVTDNGNGTYTANMTGVTYQWLDCNNGNAIISGETSQTFIPSGSGDYSVEINNNGCLDTSACFNVVSAPGYINPAMNFDGIGDFVQTTTTGVSGNTARTVEAWIKVPATNTTTQHTIVDWGSTASGSRFTTNILNQKLRLEINGAGVNGTTLLNDDTWHHIATTYDPADNDTVRIYVDGIEEAKIRMATVNTQNANIKIGTRFDNANFFFGDMDEVRIWNVAKSQAQIAAGMNNPICAADANLISSFTFNEGTPFADNTAITTLIDNAAYTTTSTPSGLAFNGSSSNFSIGPNVDNGLTFSTVTETACGAYDWALSGMNYTTSGIYTHSLTGANACDSVIVLNLTINPIPTSTIVDNGDNTISSPLSAVSYQWLDCNNSNAPITGENNQLFVPTMDGSYSVAVTTPLGCIDTSTCFNFVAVVIENVAIHFDGTGDYVATDFPGVLGNNPITVEAWIKPGGANNEEVITAWGSDAVNGGRFTFRINASGANDILRIEVKGGALEGTINVNDGLWHHVAVTYDPTAATKYSLYVDGTLDVTGNITQPLNILAATNMNIGRRLNPSFTGYFDGYMDEVRVWNITRTQGEIAADMNNEYCTLPTGLVAYYNFNDGVANADNTATTEVVDFSTTNSIGALQTFANTGMTSNFVYGPNLAAGMQLGHVDTETACEAYTWSENTTEYTASGNYFVRFTNGAGCDSLVRLNLTINQATTSTETLTVCSPYTWAQTGITYPTSGVYSDTITNTAGCDSVIVLNLTVGAPTTSTQIETACNSYEWPINNQTYNSSGLYTATIVNASGCDSTITLDLTVNNETFATETVTYCNDYVWPLNGETYTTDGSYTDTIPNTAGCDSIVTLNLTIVPLTVIATDNGDATISANLAGMNYQWIDCANNNAISGATNQTFAPTSNGIYAVVIDNGDCSDTSACVFIGNVGIENMGMNSVKFYPNPVVNELTIQFNGAETGTIQVTDIRGSIVATTYVNAENATNISLANQPSGVYYVVIKTTNHTSTNKVIKE